MLSRQSSASHAEQQSLEREVLESIFADEFSELEPADDGCRRWRLFIAAHGDHKQLEENHLALCLHATLPAAYPSVLPQVAVEAVRGLSAEQRGEVQALCDGCAAANLGTAMIFAIADEARDWLVAHNVPLAAGGGGGGLQRQGSSGAEQPAVQWAREQRRKKR